MGKPVTNRPLAAALTLMMGLVGACQRQAGSPTPPEYTNTATIKELMLSIVDPSADEVWNSVGTISAGSGTEERAPKTDEEWASVRHGAIRLIEATNLLLVPGRQVARPHEKSEAPGVELEPAQMEVLINQDRTAWNNRVKALYAAGVQALQAIEAKDAPKLFDIGETIEEACEACHSQYWYPNQTIPEFPRDFRTGAP